jgi:hypothetical protein
MQPDARARRRPPAASEPCAFQVARVFGTLADWWPGAHRGQRPVALQAVTGAAKGLHFHQRVVSRCFSIHVSGLAGQWRANTGARCGMGFTRNSVQQAGRAKRRCARAPDQRDTTAASMSTAAGSAPPRKGVGRKLVGKQLPVAVQPGPCAGAHRIQHGRVGTVAPALGVVDDANGGVAIRGDEHQRPDRLGPRVFFGRQEARRRVGQPQVDQDGGAFGQHAAVGGQQRRDLPQRVGALQLGLGGIGFPGGRPHHAIGQAAALQRHFHRCRARADRSVQGPHGRQCSHGLRCQCHGQCRPCPIRA